ncbi:MAG TPA: hypothetical protein VH682_07615 [Gemmataceae bacterium]|jgi:hypothetical protein
MPAVSLEELQQQISQRELELQALRQELETRQNQFATLASRKEDLLTQLRQIEADIAALTATSPPPATVSPAPAEVVAPTSPPHAADQPKLADLIVTMLREDGRTMTSRQLREEALRRGYQSGSRNLVKTIEVRIQDLKQKGVVRRASGQPGYVLTPSAEAAKARTAQKAPQPAPARTKKATPQAARPAKPTPAAKKTSRPDAGTSGAAKATGSVRRASQPPLQEVLTGLLQKSRQPLSGAELAKQALAVGYRTKSAAFVDVVWSKLGEMDNVEHVRGRGYQLKKTKAKT